MFVPDDPARTVPQLWRDEPLLAAALVAPKAEVGAIGISYGYVPLRGWGYVVVIHTAAYGTDF